MKCGLCGAPKVQIQWCWLCVKCDGPDRTHPDVPPEPPCWLPRVNP